MGKPVSLSLKSSDIATDLSFEKIQRQFGKTALKHDKNRRKHHDRMIHIFNADHERTTRQHADSYRSWIPLTLTVIKCACDIFALTSIAAPQPALTSCEWFQTRGLDCITRFKGDVNQFSDASQKFFSTLGNVADTMKQLFENRQAGDRTEIAAAESKLKNFLDRGHQELIQKHRDEMEQLRRHEEAQRRKSELLSALAR